MCKYVLIIHVIPKVVISYQKKKTTMDVEVIAPIFKHLPYRSCQWLCSQPAVTPLTHSKQALDIDNSTVQFVVIHNSPRMSAVRRL